MNIDDFRATGTDCDDLGAELNDEALTGSTGRIYAESLYIERWIDGRNGIAPPAGPTWLLTLYCDQFDGDLPALEQRLYDWACDEGYFDNPPTGLTGAWIGSREQMDERRAMGLTALD